MPFLTFAVKSTLRLCLSFNVLYFRRFGIPMYALPPPKIINPSISAPFPVALTGLQQALIKLVFPCDIGECGLFPINFRISPHCIRFFPKKRRTAAKSENFSSNGKFFVTGSLRLRFYLCVIPRNAKRCPYSRGHLFCFCVF